MRNYLSYGGGVNSTAMLLLLLDEGWDFEAFYVDHGCDWPETRNYVWWLSKQMPITIIRPDFRRNYKNKGGKTYNSLYDFCWDNEMVPHRVQRWCTQEFKTVPLQRYFKKPCYSLIGFSTDEAHRAKLDYKDGTEMRYPLLEYEVDRGGCKRIILEHGLPLPIKSGCYFCPFQRVNQFRELRMKHPDLFCKATQLEKRNMERNKRVGKRIYTLKEGYGPLPELVNENQGELFEEYKPPCYCEL